MNLTNKDFATIDKALMLLPSGEAFRALSEEEQDIIVNAQVTMVKLLRKQKIANEKTANAIAERRKLDPGYARSKAEKQKYSSSGDDITVYC